MDRNSIAIKISLAVILACLATKLEINRLALQAQGGSHVVTSAR